MKGVDVLNLKMTENDAVDDGDTIRDYLKALLNTLWMEGEGFSGKRPFGNSGWEYDVYKCLVAAGAVEGKLDQEGYVEDCDNKAADRLIFEAIDAL